jgi:hypothetical protein
MSGNVKFNGWINDDGSENYKCRAWVNFNGEGTVAIRASGNVSSITDNGVGNYTVNFTTAMPDANYSVVVGGQNSDVDNNFGRMLFGTFGTSTTLVSSVRMVNVWTGDGSSQYDRPNSHLAIFR